MSALRESANDLDSVWPFQHLGQSFRDALDRIDATRTDLAAMEAVEGGPLIRTDVPGAGGER